MSDEHNAHKPSCPTHRHKSQMAAFDQLPEALRAVFAEARFDWCIYCILDHGRVTAGGPAAVLRQWDRLEAADLARAAAKRAAAPLTTR